MKNLHQIRPQLEEYDIAIIWYVKVYATHAYTSVRFKIVDGVLKYTNGGSYYNARKRWNQSVITIWKNSGSPSVSHLI